MAPTASTRLAISSTDRNVSGNERRRDDDDDDDNGDDDESYNRGESVHSFDTSQSTGDSGPYPDRRYSAPPPLKRVSETSTKKRVTEWAPVQGTHDDGRILGALRTDGLDGYAAAKTITAPARCSTLVSRPTGRRLLL